MTPSKSSPALLYVCSADKHPRDVLCIAGASPWSPRIASFMRRVSVIGDGCWLWRGPVDPRFGYARTTLHGLRMGVHEAAHRMFIGDIDEGLELDHLCRVRHCCNPQHLEAVTREENMRRMRHPWPTEPTSFKTRCVNGHEYTDDNTYVRRDGDKYCRTCARIGNAVRRENRRAAKSVVDPLATMRLDTVDALAEATALHLRMLGRWQPGTITALVGGVR
jgi:hypothetical protein